MLTHDTLLEISNEEHEEVSAILTEGADTDEVTPEEEHVDELEEEAADEPGEEEEENEEEA